MPLPPIRPPGGAHADLTADLPRRDVALAPRLAPKGRRRSDALLMSAQRVSGGGQLHSLELVGDMREHSILPIG